MIVTMKFDGMTMQLSHDSMRRGKRYGAPSSAFAHENDATLRQAQEIARTLTATSLAHTLELSYTLTETYSNGELQ